jgi:hypothetical protein
MKFGNEETEEEPKISDGHRQASFRRLLS